MKKVLLTLIVIFSLITGASAQKVVIDASGNYKAVKASQDSTRNKLTGKYFEDIDGTRHPVFMGSRGGLYWVKPDGTKKYLPKNAG